MNMIKYIDAEERTKRFKRNLIKERLSEFQRDILAPIGLRFKKIDIEIMTNSENISDFTYEISYTKTENLND